ncbi:MAG: heavy metal-associated domain-containing protein [Bacilli bacterium]
MIKKTLQLEPISCPSCIEKINRALMRQNGISSAEVMFNSSKVKVAFDENLITLEEIQNVITNLGYVVKSSK